MSQSDDFAKSIAFGWWPFLAIFKMLSLSEYYLFFGAVFCIEQVQCVVETFLACFYGFLIFEPKWRFCKVYSLWLVAISGNIQNALIFQILAVSWNLFCIEQLQCVVETFFACFYACLIFDPSDDFARSLLGGHFWQFSKCSHFSNIRCFLKPFFA